MYLLLARNHSAHILTVCPSFRCASEKDVHVIMELLFGKWKQDAKSFAGTPNHAISNFAV